MTSPASSTTSPDWVTLGSQYVMGAKINPQTRDDRMGLPNPYGSSAASWEPQTQVYSPGTDPLMTGSSSQVEGFDAVDKAANDKAAADALAKAQNEAQNASGGPNAPDSPTVSGQPGSVAAFLSALKSQQGVPYVWGGASPQTGFDCSGLVSWAFNQAGISMPRYTSQSYATMGQQVSANDARPGDLMVWWEGPDVGYGHVGVYLGNGKMIAAPQSGDVVKIQDVWGDPVYRRLINDPSFGQNALPGGITEPSYNGLAYRDAFPRPGVSVAATVQLNPPPSGGQMRAI